MLTCRLLELHDRRKILVSDVDLLLVDSFLMIMSNTFLNTWVYLYCRELLVAIFFVIVVVIGSTGYRGSCRTLFMLAVMISTGYKGSRRSVFMLSRGLYLLMLILLIMIAMLLMLEMIFLMLVMIWFIENPSFICEKRSGRNL